MKVKVCIEEIITQTFEVDFEDPESNEAYKKVREMYKNKELVVENPILIEANVMIHDKNGEETDWVNLHV